MAEAKELLYRELAHEKLQPTQGLDQVLKYIEENRSKLKIGETLSIDVDMHRFAVVKVWPPTLLV